MKAEERVQSKINTAGSEGLLGPNSMFYVSYGLLVEMVKEAENDVAERYIMSNRALWDQLNEIRVRLSRLENRGI